MTVATSPPLAGELADLARDSLFAYRDGLSAEQSCRLSYARLRRIHEQLGSAVATVRDPRRLTAAMQWSAMLDETTFALLNIHYSLALGTMLDHAGDSPVLASFVAELDDMTSVGLFMATELAYGNNAVNLRTTAVYDPETREFDLHSPDVSAYKYMPNAGLADVPKLAVVLARLISHGTDHGVMPFVVRISDANGLRPGIEAVPLGDKPGFALDNALTRFRHVRVPLANMLGGGLGQLAEDGTFHPVLRSPRERFTAAMGRVTTGRLCLTTAMLACARASCAIAIRYARQRQTFAPGARQVAVLAYRSHQRALFGALAATYAMTALADRALDAYADSPEGPTAATGHLISVTKVASTWAASEIIHNARERCGAQGMFRENRIAGYVGLAQGAVTAEGDNLVLLSLTAGALVGGTGAPAWTPRPGDLADLGHLLNLLRGREETLRAQARSRLVGGDGDSFATWNRGLTTMLSFGQAAGVRLAFEELYRRCRETDGALSRLLCLYGLLEIDRNGGWYLAHGAVTADQVRELPDLIDAQCERISHDVDELVDGLAVPDLVLRVPIGGDDYLAAFAGRHTTALPEPSADLP
ncbi:acyl-CoA dehydrogenase family protein [Hamadaea tsunoensis]|uniref:acyl-CoA dehydrogenase family protein n=1 Tax=Hamadaea tsunoensis TaxID=53368 RepID=UPI0003FD6E1C|nr:acyl-CoA dehydrogenase [Hamadaea tsunoensis]